MQTVTKGPETSRADLMSNVHGPLYLLAVEADGNRSKLFACDTGSKRRLLTHGKYPLNIRLCLG